MHINKRMAGALGVTCLALGLSGLVATGASAAIGDELVSNGDFGTVNNVALAAGSTSDYQLTHSFNQASSPGGQDMYDPGFYVIGSNPLNYHNSWADMPSDPMMIVNGYTDRDQPLVWEQTVTLEPCSIGTNVKFDFNMNAMNIINPALTDGGAHLRVLLNGTLIGESTINGQPGNIVSFPAADIPYSPTVKIQVLNDSGIYSGNDFGIDDISLKQNGECYTPATAEFNIVPTAPDCDADGFYDFSAFPLDRIGYILSVDSQYHGAGDYVLTATAKTGFLFTGPGDPTVRTSTVTILPRLTVGCCVPTATIHQWYNWTGGPVTSAPSPTDPRWHAVNGDPRSAEHKWENHPTNQPYQTGKPGKADWFKWETIAGHTCNA